MRPFPKLRHTAREPSACVTSAHQAPASKLASAIVVSKVGSCFRGRRDRKRSVPNRLVKESRTTRIWIGLVAVAGVALGAALWRTVRGNGPAATSVNDADVPAAGPGAASRGAVHPLEAAGELAGSRDSKPVVADPVPPARETSRVASGAAPTPTEAPPQPAPAGPSPNSILRSIGPILGGNLEFEAVHRLSDSTTRKLRRLEIEETLVRAQEASSAEPLDAELCSALKYEALWLYEHPNP